MSILIPAEHTKIQPNMRGLIRSDAARSSIAGGQEPEAAAQTVSPFPQYARGKGVTKAASNPGVFNGFTGDTLGSRAQYSTETPVQNPLDNFHQTATPEALPALTTATGQPTVPIDVTKDNYSIQPHERGKFFNPRVVPAVRTAGGARVSGGGVKANTAFQKTKDKPAVPQTRAKTARFIKGQKVPSFRGNPVTLHYNGLITGRWSQTKRGAAG